MTTLQKIVKAAQALRKKYPNKYPKWTDYVKAASKQISGLEKVTKSGNKTTVLYSKKIKPAKKKAAPKKAVQSTLFGVKKAAPKKKAAPRSSHKDTKSHNVNIRVISGANDKFFHDQLKAVSGKIAQFEAGIYNDQKQIKTATTAQLKTFFRTQIKRKREHIRGLKKQLTLIKKSIK